MASRRGAAPPTQPPRYLGVSDGSSSPTNPLVAFWRSQVVAPEHRQGNLNILLGVSVFAAGVIGVRTFGGILVPSF